MWVEVAVHSLLRHHSVAESTFIRTAARRRLQLCPHISCITQLRAPEGLQGRRNQRKQYIIYDLNNPYTHSIKACWTAWPSSWSICCFKKKQVYVDPKVCTNAQQQWRQKAILKCLIISLFMCLTTQGNQPIIKVHVGVIQGKNLNMENWNNFKIWLHVIHNFVFIRHLHTSANKIPLNSDSVMCFHLAHIF